jgi:CDP-glucose 4,6-dehydratase
MQKPRERFRLKNHDMQKELSAYAGKRVLITGHTGFKGAWLCEWLLGLGAEVYGWSLPPQDPSLFEALDLAHRANHLIGDVLDLAALNARMQEVQPHFIFHLAAQSLVRISYREPLLTFSTNVIGTAKLLEAVRAFDFPCTVVVITTDKCYENNGRARSFKESDPLGGHDPYSASKAGAELVVAAYRDSFFQQNGNIALASARAGNVIGGGDWAEARIVPDCVRALSTGQSISVRNPDFTRPWQHVLEPLSGYLVLGARLEASRHKKSGEETALYAQAFNFGPEPEANRSVRDLVEEVLRHWPGKWEQASQESHLKEASLLSLAIDKAKETLDWQPRWNFTETVEQTMTWYHEYFARKKKSDAPSMIDFTQKQIAAYLT